MGFSIRRIRRRVFGIGLISDNAKMRTDSHHFGQNAYGPSDCTGGAISRRFALGADHLKNIVGPIGHSAISSIRNVGFRAECAHGDIPSRYKMRSCASTIVRYGAMR